MPARQTVPKRFAFTKNNPFLCQNLIQGKTSTLLTNRTKTKGHETNHATATLSPVQPRHRAGARAAHLRTASQPPRPPYSPLAVPRRHKPRRGQDAASHDTQRTTTPLAHPGDSGTDGGRGNGHAAGQHSDFQHRRNQKLPGSLYIRRCLPKLPPHTSKIQPLDKQLGSNNRV